MKVIGIIPARYHSSRFPGKPLIDLAGKSMLQRVYENAFASKIFDVLIIATDHEKILNHCTDNNLNVVLTDSNHQSGTERCIEVVESLLQTNLINQDDVVINIQGDEPLANWEHFKIITELLNKGNAIATLGTPLTPHLQKDTNAVKVIVSDNLAVKFTRDWSLIDENDKIKTFKHVGLYGFKVRALLEIKILKATKEETLERLEQLRWFYNDMPISVGIIKAVSLSIDTPKDVNAVLHEIYKKKLNTPLNL